MWVVENINGDYSRNASSGDNARNASSGDNAQNASSGYNAQNASSGDNARNASSGYNARNASSGYNAQNTSSGDNTQNASSGDYSQNLISGKDSVVFDCGFRSAIKAVNGTWISLCEYQENNNGIYIPYFAASAQIGNLDYVDYQGNILSEKEFYILNNKQFTPVILDDRLGLIKKTSKMKGEIEIIKCVELGCEKESYCVRKGDLSSHGKTLKQAIADLQLKEMQKVRK